MKTPYIIIIFITILCYSCKTPQEDQKEALQNETPEVLEDYNVTEDFLSHSRSKWYTGDLVAKLYNEALEKDPELNKVHLNALAMKQIHIDSLAAYYKYTQTNAQYWNAVESYYNQINDSILKSSMKTTFDTLAIQYNKKMQVYTAKMDSIESQQERLSDQLILMKLAVTQKMMTNYQEQQQPNIKTMEKLLSKYDTLLEETKAYTQMNPSK